MCNWPPYLQAYYYIMYEQFTFIKNAGTTFIGTCAEANGVQNESV